MNQEFEPRAASFGGEASIAGPTRGIEDTQPAARWEDAFLSGNGRHRISFVSRADRVIVQRLTAPTNGKLTASFHLSGELAAVPADMAFVTQITTDTAGQLFLTLKGI